MAKYRSKEDDVNCISISIFVMNFPESFYAKDLFHTCKQYGHVVDSFIPSKRTKNARFQRKPLNEMNTSAKTMGKNNRGGDKSSRSFGGAMGSGNSYINVLKSSNGVGHLESHCPDIVLNDDCVISKELSYSLMGTVKEFALLTNLKTTLLNEGFVDLSVRYLGELWVLLEFSSSKTKEAFCVNVGVSSCFSKIRQASLDIIPDGRIVWVEIIFRGKIFWIHGKEVPGWVPGLIEESEEEEQSDVGSLEGDNKMKEDDLCGDNMDMVDVPETVFDESNGQKKDVSQNPFGTNVNSGIGDKSINYNADEGTIGGDGVSVNVNSKGDNVDSVSIGRFKKSETPRSGGSFLCLMEEVVKVGQTMGYNMEGVVNNLSDIIESHGKSLWHGEVVIMGDFNEVRCKSDSAITLERYLSDHRPILLRESIHDYGPVPFRFFHHWLELDGFYTFVSDTWRNAPEDRCNRKVAFDKLKEELRLVDEAIDKGVGTEEVVNKRVEVLNSLRYIDQMHAMDLAQKAKIKWSIEDDENSSFFHGMLNKKRNQSNIRGIMVDDVWKEQPNDVKHEFLNHFQERFDRPVERRVTIDMSYPRSISGEQRDELEREMTIEEIKMDVWNCGTDKSPGPDGFTFDFYLQFWSTIDKDVYAAINHFFINGDIPAGCNSSFKALISKAPDANLVKDFRPVSLIGSIYKIIAKILTNRLINILGDIVCEVQSAFVAGRQILDGLKINLCKSKIMGVNVEGSYVNQAAVKLGFQVLTNPFIYLGTKLGGTMSRVQAWQEVVEKVKTRLSKWKMKTLSIGGRLTLLKYVLGSIPIFHMSIFKVPLRVLQIL
nr:RNA-directed DNA polymerase, eukaryota [Tanacetum cinerariifolium]